MSRLLTLSLLLLLSCVGCSSNSARQASYQYNTIIVNKQFRCSPAAAIKREMLALINKARSQPRSCGKQRFPGVAPLTWNAALKAAAADHSLDMARGDFFSHSGSDDSDVSNRVDAAGYEWRRVGENLYGGAERSEQAVRGWLRSPAHCRNIMNPDFKQMGAACARNSASKYGTYWTQVLATAL
ncbi:MAG: CAP domain-containing protein [Gammaproteobacteria bacterium]|nr:CAP domain-containing protein [Gammaproteobacteria bacterium]